MSGWFPVGDGFEVVPRHVARTALSGHELVVWRADDGNVNVWENRCLHRGVRLSIGINSGAELVCRYHGWRYANESGGCTYIPAHPADSPARTIHCSTFAAAERYGLVWTSLSSEADPSAIPSLPDLDAEPFTLRSRPLRAPADVVVEQLSGLRFLPSASLSADLDHVEVAMVAIDDTTVSLTATGEAGDSSTVTFFVQPVAADRAIIRPVMAGRPAEEMAVWRHHAEVLGRFVERVEQLDTAERAPLAVALETPVELSTTKAVAIDEPIPVVVQRKWSTAQGIVAFELAASVGGALPTPQPGDHIDVHLPGGLVRQYSLTNGPGEMSSYRIGVKRAPDSTGGSAALHDDVEVGDVLQISPPRNSFPLRRNVPRTLLIAGGVGVTPILSMAQALDASGLDTELHYFAGSGAELAFPDILDRLGDRVHQHLGRDADGTRTELEHLLADPNSKTQIYACGPPPMLDLIQSLAADFGWPEEALTFEYFQNDTEIDRTSSFTIDLARSALTLEVPAGVSILDVVRANGVAMVSSCEQGACGTCAVSVLEGDPLHQDVYLSAAEREANTTMLTCVSRAASDHLVLDL